MRVVIDVMQMAVIAAFFAAGLALSKGARGADLPIPIPKPRELCVAPDVKPAPGQTIHVDPTCPSGMRWRREK